MQTVQLNIATETRYTMRRAVTTAAQPIESLDPALVEQEPRAVIRIRNLDPDGAGANADPSPDA